MSCKEIRAEWAAQRIRGLSLRSLIANAFGHRPKNSKNGVIKTLIQEFLYPRLGPGMMWAKVAGLVESQGGSVLLNTPVDRVQWEPGRVISVSAGNAFFEGSHFVSTMAIRDLISAMEPAVPETVRNAADSLKYRDFLIVALVVSQRELFPDTWIYIHDPQIRVGRIQNFVNWSPDLIPNQTTTCLGMEYFCTEGDDLWAKPDAELRELAKQELVELGLAPGVEVLDASVIRVKKAYPVYDETYRDALRVVRDFLQQVPNLQLIGRNGMHRYNNQDHSMLTGILAARNILGDRYDLWAVNIDTEYHEQGGELSVEDLEAMQKSQPAVPERLTPK